MIVCWQIQINKIYFMSNRKREFGNERVELSKSNLSRSRNQTTFARSNITPSRTDRYQIATPQSNKHQQPSQSQYNNNSRSDLKLNKKSSDYICVGCFNDKLATDKKRHIRQQLLMQKQQQRLTNQTLIDHTHQEQAKHSQHQKEINQIKNYNLKLIQQKQQLKAKQKILQQQLNSQEKQQQQRLEKEERIKMKQKQAIMQKYNAIIKHQINQKNTKYHQLSPSEIQGSANNIFGKSQDEFFKQKAQKQQLYRQQLLKQIKDRKEMMKQQIIDNQNIQKIGTDLTEAAYQREIERQKKLHHRQQQIINETKIMMKIRQKQQYQEQLNQQKLQEQRIQQEKVQKQEEKRFRQQKQKQADSYRVDLRQQIESSKRKRQQEERQMHYFINTSMQFKQKQPEKKSCRSCDKKFPKTFLTKIN